MSVDCPICFEMIEGQKNCVTTECGHQFHTKCLMMNVAHNGFGCPCCRSIMAEDTREQDDEDDWSDSSSEESSQSSDSNSEEEEEFALRGFRMLMNRLEGTEIEQQDLDDDNTLYYGDDEDEIAVPSIEYMTDILLKQGVTMYQLVGALMSYKDEYEVCEDTERVGDFMWDKMGEIIRNFSQTRGEILIDHSVPDSVKPTRADLDEVRVNLRRVFDTFA